ncbi:MAG: restriction endonuclease subunit S [Spirochaeta sp.]|nr:restriction endonuclease subunit S [Spirochaeta sp.]
MQPSTQRVEPQDEPSLAYLSLEHIAAGKRLIIGRGTGADVGSTKTRFHAGDVLYGRLRPYLNKVVIPDFDGMCSTDILVFPEGPVIDNRFLLYYLSQQRVVDFATRNSSGISLPRISFSKLSELEIQLPPRAEQQRIAAFVAELQARMQPTSEGLGEVLPLCERLHDAVLRSAFRGELTAEWRKQQPHASVEERLKRTPPPAQPIGGRSATDRLIPGVGGISVNNPHVSLPRGWQWTPLLRLARQETGHTPSRSEPNYWSGDVPWIGIRDAAEHHGMFIHQTHQHVSQAGLANSSARLLPPGTVCLSRTASVGYVVIMGKAMATSQDFATWTCTTLLDPEYLMYALLSEGSEIRRFGKGTTHTTIYFPEIRAFHIALAPIEEQREIVRRVRGALSSIQAVYALAQDQIQQLSLLDQVVISLAVKGQLVSQHPDDEPASVLLSRIREASDAAIPPQGRKIAKKDPAMSRNEVRSVDDLTQRLKELGDAASPEALLLAAGLGDDVDRFYELLRDGRDAGLLSVPTGVAGTIRRRSNANP